MLSELDFVLLLEKYGRMRPIWVVEKTRALECQVVADKCLETTGRKLQSVPEYRKSRAG